MGEKDGRRMETRKRKEIGDKEEKWVHRYKDMIRDRER